MMILVVGGDEDPNIAALIEALEQRGTAHRPLLVGSSSHPRVTWEVESGDLFIDGERTAPKGMFIRHDVFSGFSDPRPDVGARAHGWYTALSGWALAREEVRLLNRNWAQRLTNKPLHLELARKSGLAVPSTIVSNDLAHMANLAEERELVVKPINGGGYCEELADVLKRTEERRGSAAMPAIVQDRMILPEVRIYGIGGKFIPFSVSSEALDYRAAKECKVEALKEAPEETVQGLAQLMERLGMDYGAADFKTCPRTGKLLFLEINSGPMFSRFNYVSGGAVCNAMIDFLTGES
jgi:hypothetical protein